MFETKLFEVRDRGTFIPTLATRFTPDQGDESFLLRRAGFAPNEPYVIVHAMEGSRATYDPFKHDSNTMRVAHQHIEAYWSTLNSGYVIDVEFLRGETATPKTSERLESVVAG